MNPLIDLLKKKSLKRIMNGTVRNAKYTAERATKKLEIYFMPKYLIIHLKRFNNETMLDDVVDFPIIGLDTAEYVISGNKDTKFNLVAIANHYGSMGLWHYTAFDKNHKKDKWCEFDESVIERRR